MASVTGLAASSITSMIPGLCAAGQMKLVGATSAQNSVQSGAGGPVAVSLASIIIPALTGSQIAIVYLEVSSSMYSQSGATPQGAFVVASASGTGVNLNVSTTSGVTGTTSGMTNIIPAKNSAFSTTTTGNQTVTFSGSTGISGGSSSYTYGSVQACVFIYTPPF